jgi:uncharacterized protein YbjT (DUF2867 family)
MATRRSALVLALSAAMPAAATAPRVLIVGGSGRTGSLVVRDLLARGFAVKGLARRVADAKAEMPDVAWFAGDVRDPKSLPPAMAGVDVVVYAVGGTRDHDPANGATALFDAGVAATVAAAKAAGVRHFVLLSSAGVTRIGAADQDPLVEVMTAKRAGEDHVRKSGMT